MTPLLRQIRHAFAHNLPERRQLIAWAVSAVIFSLIAWFGHRAVPNDRGFLTYALALYVIDSIVFFALFAERPKLRLVMLTFIFLLEVAAVGFFVLKFASPR
jgi:ABC-type multidrug transport system fused ATPase/permease subunit